MIEEIMLIIDGIYEYFYSGTASEYGNSIVSISPVSTTLDPLEPIVDSSPFTVELAADAVYGSGRLRDLFSRDPVRLGIVSKPYRSGDGYIWLRDVAPDADGDVCISTGSFQIYYDHDDGSDSVFEITENTPCNLYVDQTMGIAPEVTRYPRVWKGRQVKIFLGDLWRVCYLTENPRITLSSVILTMAPLDARIRDHHPTPLLPTVGHFAEKGRNNVTAPKTKHLCFWASGRSPTYTIGVMAGASSYALVSGTVAYTGLYNTIQNTTSAPPGGMLIPPQQTAHRIFTPCAPAIGKVGTSVGYWGITGRSSNTISFDISITSGDYAYSFTTLPAIRVFQTNGSGTGATQVSNRFATASYSDPLITLTIGAPNNGATVLALAKMRTAYNNGPPLSIGFIWSQNEQGEEPVIIGRVSNGTFTDNIVHEWAQTNVGALRNAATCADSEAGLDALMSESDNYSLKPINAPSAEVALSKRSNNQVQPVSDRAASYEISPVSSITLAQATNYWVAGEPQLCLDQKFGNAGERVWFTVSWTEDGENFFERTIDLVYRDEPSTGIYRYDIGRQLNRQVARNSIAGIGDWFGNRATFTVDQTLASSVEGDLLFRYFTSTSLIASLLIPDFWVHRSSFYDNSSSICLIDTWRFEGPKALDENIGALLALSSTAISFDSSDYQIRRKWIGPIVKDETPLTIGEDELLEIPTAELEDHIVADYSLTFADDQKVTYTDIVAKSLFNAEKTFELDLSLCSLNESMSAAKMAQEMRGTLASMVNRFGAEVMSYRVKVPFSVGKDITPGDSIALTCSRIVGAANITPPNGLPCRVFDVDQDIMAQTTNLRVIAVDGGVAKYQRGARILSGFGTTVVTVDDTSWVSTGETVYFGNNSTATVNAKTSSTLTLSASPKYCNYLWAKFDQIRFDNAHDKLG